MKRAGCVFRAGRPWPSWTSKWAERARPASNRHRPSSVTRATKAPSAANTVATGATVGNGAAAATGALAALAGRGVTAAAVVVRAIEAASHLIGADQASVPAQDQPVLDATHLVVFQRRQGGERRGLGLVKRGFG